MRFYNPVSCHPSCCQAAVHEGMLGRNFIGNARVWTEFLVAMLENPATVVALKGCMSLPHQRLLLLVAVSTWRLVCSFSKSCCF